ncbi:EAL domain-containing protein [Pelomonas sp. KK5]|uniref:EAL domain-containing protein n=1 Tax=Pelomonas sp. KK5 TaxID=1855730 RepID=UPI00097BEC64|nr:EAL domain-containing protein [Pelomonas sp. KK5]
MTPETEAATAPLQQYLSRREDGRWQADYQGLRLESHFQPIWSFPHRRTVGHEALLRVADGEGQARPPMSFFDRLAGFEEKVLADRLTRLLHLHNFTAQRNDAGEEGWLFLNIHPAVFVHAAGRQETLRASVEVLDRLGMPAHRTVLEVTEDVIAHDAEFEAAVANARETGCLLALDDFGAGHSNFDRVWRIQPEIVKLDRSLLRRAADSPRIARVMTQMVSLLHECGALVLLEGVETHDEALIALDADVDLAQGFAFGRPAPALVTGEAAHSAEIEQAWERLDERHAEGRAAHAQRMTPFSVALKKALPGLRQNQPLHQACAALLALPGVQLAYLLDEHGIDCCAPVAPAYRNPGLQDRRFAPLEQAGHARWARRPYFRRAVAELGQVQVTRPYLSLKGARMCVTMSMAFWSQGKMQVICVDLDWAPGDD